MSEQYEGRYYRTANYCCIEDAEKNGMVSQWETTFGYSSTMDSFSNAINLISNYDPSIIDEYRFIWIIDGVKFPEMDYKQSVELLDASYDSFAKGTKDQFLNLNKNKEPMQIKETSIHAIIERITEITHPVHGRLYVVEHISKDNKSFYRRIQNWQTDDLTVDLSDEDRQAAYDLVAKHHNTPYAY